MSSRRAAAVYALLLLLLMLIDLPKQVVVADPPQPPVPTTQGPCDDIWKAVKFNRFMVYDKVVDPSESRMGPEVKGRMLPEVQNDLRERLCLDDALFRDLVTATDEGYDSWDFPYRSYQIEEIWLEGRSEYRAREVARLLNTITNSNPRIEKSNAAFESWYHLPGKSFESIPGLGITTSGPQRSVFLVYDTKRGTMRLRLECGFQPTQLL